MSTPGETLGQRIARLREAAGLTQKGLAERAGLPFTSLRNWEQDAREPLASAVGKLAVALGVSADVLLGTAPLTEAPAGQATTRKPGPGRPRKTTTPAPEPDQGAASGEKPKRKRGKRT
jgi:transcriptional regulator with XRE-family HTH domain